MGWRKARPHNGNVEARSVSSGLLVLGVFMTKLLPADMPAVLARTNLTPGEDNLLLPIYEAISNAIHSCEARWGTQSPEKGTIAVDIQTDPFAALVEDNGTGLDERRFQDFRTPFTGTKLKKGGKGFGRFIAFKVFEQIEYHSRFSEGDSASPSQRSFKFDIYSADELTDIDSGPTLQFDLGCSVQMSTVRTAFQNVASKIEDERLVDRIIRYFLPNFLKATMPKLTITVDSTVHDVVARSSSFFPSATVTREQIAIDGISHSFDVGIAKVIRSELFPNHMMMLFADGRIIGSGRSIERKIGTSSFENSAGEKQVYVATVAGEFLDSRANTARTQIEASEEEIDQVVAFVSDKILAQEHEFVDTHRGTQTTLAVAAITRNPLLRTALHGTSITDYVRSKPMSWKAEDFVSDLALVRYRDQTHWDRVFDSGLKAPEKLKDMRDEILKHLDAESKDALAAYVSHRKAVLELAEATLGYQDDGRLSLEDVFHDLIHPRYEDSESTKFYQHNLWLIDDRLAFFGYISSDRTIHGGRRRAGDKVADIIMFDDCSVYREGDDDTLVLVEFKRPRRDDYKFGNPKSDPVQQLFETALTIREQGRLVTSTGRTIEVPEGVRIFGYVVADLEPSLKAICLNHDMRRTWDDRGFYRYHETRDVFVEVIGYDKMVGDAKKRNAAFFEVLLGDVVI